MPDRIGFTARVLLVVGIGVAAAVGTFALVPPVPQPESYHHFADARPLLGVPNFGNVVSNVPYLLVGAAGLWCVLRPGGAFLTPAERWPYALVFAGVFLTGFGSAYYHGEPTTGRLVWDRLPMALAFTALLAGMVAERIDVRVGVALLGPLVAAGVGSVWYWHVGEGRGAGDLRAYGLVQFYSLTAIALLLLLFPPRYTGTGWLWAGLACYGVAKVCEEADGAVYRATGLAVSGHTLKHLASAAGACAVLHWLRTRASLSAVRHCLAGGPGVLGRPTPGGPAAAG